MVEVKEVLLLWLAGQGKKAIARQVGLDPRTVRSYVAAAEAAGLTRSEALVGVSDELLAKTLAELRPSGGRPHGDAWVICEKEREEIARLLQQDVRLSKTRRLLLRRGVTIPYSTLHRFAVEELGFGRAAPTIPVADGKAGEEIELDTGWVLWLEGGDGEKRRHVRAWIFTPNVSRYRFVWPVLEETTASAIGACEAAWEFYGGIVGVLRPDNTKAIVTIADALNPRITSAFLEYAQARSFHIDPARVRKPKDKARVERSFRDVRDDCFGGELLHTVEQARERGQRGQRPNTACASTAPRSEGRRSISRRWRNRRCCPRRPSGTTCRSGAIRRSRAITWRRSRVRSTRYRRGSSARRCMRAPTATWSASTTVTCW